MREELAKMTLTTMLILLVIFAGIALVLHCISDAVDYLLSKLGVEEHETE